MQRYLDVDPADWFYRAILEAERIKVDPYGEENLIDPKTYNVFRSGHERKVFVFVSEENQKVFEISDYEIPSGAKVILYIEGVRLDPSKVEKKKVHLPNPITSDQEVVILIQGRPSMASTPCDPEADDCKDGQCYEYPRRRGTPEYPSAELSQLENYVFDIRYSLNEVATVFGRRLKRINVVRRQGETNQQAVARTIGNKRYAFTILDGVIYVSFHLNELPIRVNYNYYNEEEGAVKNLQNERVFPSSDNPLYDDRFFPNVHVRRHEFFTMLQKLRVSFYNRFTDRGYVATHPNYTERKIADKSRIRNQPYAEDVLNILDEKFLDGCYVFPLYEDGKFEPNGCVTKAEVAVYLNRFIEWALERFR